MLPVSYMVMSIDAVTFGVSFQNKFVLVKRSLA